MESLVFNVQVSPVTLKYKNERRGSDDCPKATKVLRLEIHFSDHYEHERLHANAQSISNLVWICTFHAGCHYMRTRHFLLLKRIRITQLKFPSSFSFIYCCVSLGFECAVSKLNVAIFAQTSCRRCIVVAD